MAVLTIEALHPDVGKRAEWIGLLLVKVVLGRLAVHTEVRIGILSRRGDLVAFLAAGQDPVELATRFLSVHFMR